MKKLSKQQDVEVKHSTNLDTDITKLLTDIQNISDQLKNSGISVKAEDPKTVRLDQSLVMPHGISHKTELKLQYLKRDMATLYNTMEKLTKLNNHSAQQTSKDSICKILAKTKDLLSNTVINYNNLIKADSNNKHTPKPIASSKTTECYRFASTMCEFLLTKATDCMQTYRSTNQANVPISKNKPKLAS